MKKIAVLISVFAGLILPAVSFSADTATVLYATGTNSIPKPEETKPYEPASGDTPAVKGELTFPAVSDRNYTFATVIDALDFAKNPPIYIMAHYNFNTASYDPKYEPPLDATLTKVSVAIEAGAAELDDTVDLTDYSSISEVTFTAARPLTVPSGSRHFILGGDSNVTFSGVNFSGQNTGGGVEVRAGTAAFTGVTFSRCQTSGNGGGLLVTGGTVTVSGNSSFTNSNANYGGGIAVTGGSVSVSDTNFTGNSAVYGGAVYSSSGLTLGANTVFNDTGSSSPNTATNGGALYVAGGTTNISGANVSFTENSAENGGALYSAGGTINISGSGVIFTGNVASDDGGAIYSSSRAILNLTGDDLSITSNTASEGNGGGIYLANGVGLTFSSSASTLKGNTAYEGDGGAVYAAGGNTINLSGSATVESNQATNGGALFMAQARTATLLNITGTSEVVFKSNIASNDGGAIYAQPNANMTFEPEVTFSGNYTQNGNGGALWVSDPSQLPEGTVFFEGNQARKAVASSTVKGSGGAVYAEGSSSSAVTIGTTKDYSFTDNNLAQSYGGAFCSSSGDVTFEGYTGDDSITARNTAWLGGGFAASYAGIIRISNSTITNQITTRGSGGAVWAKNIVVTSADFGSSSYPNESQGTGNNNGGGALYSNGSISLTNAEFGYNAAAQGGGAVYADTASVTIRNSYFHHNRAHGGNGGAVNLRNYCTTTISSTTFASNTSENLDGGAVYAQGSVEISQSYFNENLSRRSGGAVYFDQSNSQAPYSFFSISTSMLTDNSTLGGNEGGNGGGIFVASNRAVITSCTFNKNHIELSGNSGEGGGVYLNTATIQSGTNRIENCTFYENSVNDGAAPNSDSTSSSGGGGLSVHCEGRTDIVSCTFSMNSSRYNGGAIYLGPEDGTLSLAGTIAVGNTGAGIYDIWSDGNISSGGYNRIGSYGTGSGATDFYSEARNETDRTSYPAKGWTKSTFFGDNELAVNARTDLGGSIPPYIGSSRAGQVRLLTLMLNEAETLPLVDRATNVIPFSRRTSFPNNDERGVSRVSGGAEIALDVGACFFDGTRASPSPEVIDSYEISRIEMGGIPNNLRRVGQTASLLSKIYYSNGRTVFGGNGVNEEPVEWTSDKPTIIRINKDTGDITVLNVTPGNTYVTITVKTLRTNFAGAQLSNSKPIRVTEYTYSYLNTTPTILNYIYDYIEDIAEYDISLTLPDVNSSYVSTSSFQSAFSSAWSGVSASQVTDISDGSLTLTKSSGYTSTDGMKSIKNAGVNVNLRNRKTGDLFPMTYTWLLSGKDIENLLGYDLSESAITDELADSIFSAMRLDFQGMSATLPVIGNGGVKASEARSAGVLTLNKADGEKGLSVELTAYLANVSSSGGLSASASKNDGPQLISSNGRKLLVVPDGSGNDGTIYGTMWAAGKADGASTPNGGGNSGSNGTSPKSSSGGGGGGCSAFGLMMSGALLMFMIRRRH